MNVEKVVMNASILIRAVQRCGPTTHGPSSRFRVPRSAFLVLFLLLGSALLLPRSAFSDDVPAALNYQGRLTDNLGNALTTGYYHIEFRVWDDPLLTNSGSLVWGRMFPLHVMQDGIFNLLLTDDGGLVTNPAPQVADLRDAFESEDAYLGLTVVWTPAGAVGSPKEISPRQRLVSAPYTFHAQHATAAAAANFASNAAHAALAAAANGGFAVTGGLTVVSGTAALNGGLAVAGTAALNGGLTVHGPTALASATVVSNTLEVTGNLTVDAPATLAGCGTVPIGTIVLWYGAPNNVPSGWALCNGATNNGYVTPDLQDRFVVGAGRGYAPYAQGGSSNVTLTLDQIPPHTHGYWYAPGSWGYAAVEDEGNHYWKSQEWTASGTAGGGQPHENRPPYYALCYIMRVK
jgi:microcystin-dependent protein